MTAVNILLSMILGFAVAARGRTSDSDAHVFGDSQVWRWPPSRAYHVKNYRLALHFDEAKGEVFGDETLTLQSFESHFHKFFLNSTGLQIDSVNLEQNQGPTIKLAYSALDQHLWITLDREYDADRVLRVRIVYHGFPSTGLFFVNPTKDYPKWPREVYSQGEPEFNHYWFPCWDYPNDMSTNETITTVPKGQTVVSNGRLVKVTHDASETTFDWVESVPHSSYLISIAVGPWRKVSDQYENKPVDYYVPDYVDLASARRSFHLTPDMIGFFSRTTGVDYPYEQYAQTTVHNFIFGGQENVSATTLTEYTLHDARADQDYPSTLLVAHELGQHWFGDYVQGRDWANIWLNEGFATYLEALYTQYHEGNDAYRYGIYSDQMTEQTQQRQDYLRPIVDRHYSDPLQMFDTITHQKGAAVLDMLRYVVDGPNAASHPASQSETLFRALHYYLVAHRSQTADTDDLVQAIRQSTGMELDWFFHEWVYMAGHPDYRVSVNYDDAKRSEQVSIAQTQHGDEITPAFVMPIEIQFHGAQGESKTVTVHDDSAQQEFDVPLEFKPLWVDFDPDDFIDKTLEFSQSSTALIAEAEQDPSMMARLWAVQQLGVKSKGDSADDAQLRINALERVLANDEFYGVRVAAATSLAEMGGDETKKPLITALKQSDSRVRRAVVQALGNFTKDQGVYDALMNALRSDASYAVEAAAAEQIGRSGNPGAFQILQAKDASEQEVHVTEGILAGIASTKDPRAAAILLAQAQPGVTERARLSALAGLSTLKGVVEQEHSQELAATVRAALDDPFLPVHQAGEQLAGEFHLIQFEADIRKDLNAPLMMQRSLAQEVLGQLQVPQH
jgi:aminopeptidase N